MILNKYSQPKEKEMTVGSFSDRSSSAPSGSSGSSSSGLDREIWGKRDSGDDISGDIIIDGNAYVGPVSYDEEENPLPPDHEFPSDEGNLFATTSIASPEVHGRSLFLDIGGVKTNLLDVLMPVGSVIMFNGASAVPANWAVCDGKNGTPDLTGRFIKGVTTKDGVGMTGGSSSVDLGNNVPAHTHTFANFLTQVNGNGEIFNGTITINGKELLVGRASHEGNPTRRAQTSDSGYSDIPVIFNETDSAGVSGEGGTVEIEPPFYTLIYIVRVR